MGIIAKGHEMRGDVASAAIAWESIRRSVLSTRHVIQPNLDLLERAEREVERLRRTTGRGEEGGDADPVARPADPSVASSILLFGGLLAWIAGAISLLAGARREPGSGRSFSAGRLISWATCLGGLALWLAMSWLAG
jgi:hypothetical protein